MSKHTAAENNQNIRISKNALILTAAILLTLIGAVLTLLVGSHIPTHYDTIEIPGYKDIGLKEGEEDLDIILKNPPGNPCSFRYDLKLAETDELLYSSPVLLPGEESGTCSITRPFTAGKYPVNLILTCASPDDGTPLNTVSIKLSLRVSKQ